MGRRGRPRKSIEAKAAARAKAADPRRDWGTDELAERRHILTGAGDPTLSESSLGILRARGHIAEEQMDAGFRLAVLRWNIFGKGTPDAVQWQDYLPGAVLSAPDEERDARLWEAYKSADDALRAAGSGIRRETQNVAAYGRVPSWLYRSNVRTSDSKARQHLLDGLAVLVDHWGMKTRSKKGVAAR
jgi:hypothetical protein